MYSAAMGWPDGNLDDHYQMNFLAFQHSRSVQSKDRIWTKHAPNIPQTQTKSLFCFDILCWRFHCSESIAVSNALWGSWPKLGAKGQTPFHFVQTWNAQIHPLDATNTTNNSSFQTIRHSKTIHHSKTIRHSKQFVTPKQFVIPNNSSFQDNSSFQNNKRPNKQTKNPNLSGVRGYPETRSETKWHLQSQPAAQLPFARCTMVSTPFPDPIPTPPRCPDTSGHVPQTNSTLGHKNNVQGLISIFVLLLLLLLLLKIGLLWVYQFGRFVEGRSALSWFKRTPGEWFCEGFFVSNFQTHVYVFIIDAFVLRLLHDSLTSGCPASEDWSACAYNSNHQRPTTPHVPHSFFCFCWIRCCKQKQKRKQEQSSTNQQSKKRFWTKQRRWRVAEVVCCFLDENLAKQCC